MSERTVGLIMTTPVKSMAIHFPEEVELTMNGVPDDRQFFLIDDRDRLFVGRRHGRLVQIRSRLEGEELVLEFPDGTVVRGEPELGEATSTDFYELRMVAGREVRGPFSEALSDYTGSKVRLIKAAEPIAYDAEPATLLSQASIDRLGREMGTDLDPRRFRMLFTLNGCEEHEEDSWTKVRVGDALLEVGSAIGKLTPRCAVVTQDPDTGARSGDTLKAIKGYRGLSEDNRWIVFGVYASVLEPGRVRLGDPVVPV